MTEGEKEDLEKTKIKPLEIKNIVLENLKGQV